MKNKIYLSLIFMLMLGLFTLKAEAKQKKKEESKKKIIFVKSKTKDYYNLFTAICSEYLKDKGFIPEIIELNLENQFFTNKLVLAKTLEKVKEERPDIILALGFIPSSLMAKNTSDIPLVCSLIQKDEAEYIKVINNKTTGVITDLMLEKKFRLLKKMMPSVTSIGFICNQRKNKKTVYEAKTIARQFKLKPIVINVEKELLLAKALSENINKVQAVTLIPTSDKEYDLNLIKYTATRCAEKNKIFIGLEPLHVSNGAFFAIYPDMTLIARKTAVIIKRILDYESPSAIPFEKTSKSYQALNLNLAKRINAKLNSELLDKIDVLIK